MPKLISLAAMTVVLAAGAVALSAGCAAQTADEGAGASQDPIVNGTPQALGANSFVQLPGAGCTGTLLTNRFVITAGHCFNRPGDPVYMDNQASVIRQLVVNPNQHDPNLPVDVMILRIDPPLAVGGNATTFHRNVRTDFAPAGGHVRCFGYGSALAGQSGISSNLRLMEVQMRTGLFFERYFLTANTLGQTATRGDAGGACLDDNGSIIGLMQTDPSGIVSGSGTSVMVASSRYASWQSSVINQCSSNADCWTGVCNASQGVCVSSHCFDGVKDSGEEGVDCGGTCAKACRSRCGGLVDCGDGRCVKFPSQCP